MELKDYIKRYFPDLEVVLFLKNPDFYEEVYNKKRKKILTELFEDPEIQTIYLESKQSPTRIFKIIDINTQKVIYEKSIPADKDITPSENIPIAIQKLAAGSEEKEMGKRALHFTPKGLKLFDNGEMIDIETDKEVIRKLGSTKNWSVSIV
ncbi:MAG: hypothetical protein KA146_02385 [Leptospiraceae bacterium]|nr:hypothetical protein [Leptospiraceae bacterium]